MSNHESSNGGQRFRPLQVVHEAVESSIDPMGVFLPLLHAQLAWAAHPLQAAERSMKLMHDMGQLALHISLRSAGLPSPDPLCAQCDDERFADPVWTDVAAWDAVKESYLLLTRHIQDSLYETPGLSKRERRRAAFWWRKALNALAPNNFLPTNPVALRKAVETGGESLLQGFQNFLRDLESGTVRMADPGDFKVGESLATTPGKVIYRNPLLEVIHYKPIHPRTQALPIVLVTPWINKFYVLDLNPKRSLVAFLLDQGFEVYITSWKNPGADMAQVRFDDYLEQGVAQIVRVAREHSGAAKVHAVGYCIGGTLLSCYMAWLNQPGTDEADIPVAHWTLFTTLVDFHKPGDIEVFLDETSVDFLEKQMQWRGYLDGKDMAFSFRLLRSNSLIWHYVVHGWLYGESPPPFDVLYWNMDTTRMPAAMHSWYLRELYLRNRLIRPDALSLAGRPLDLSRIRQPLYAVGAEDDHIAPWRECFRINHFVAGPKRFVLSSSGHILGILNPPVQPPRRSYQVAEVHRADDLEAWQARASSHQGSWWEDWMAWLKPQAGELVPARPTAGRGYAALADAPGTYVLER